MIVQKPKKKKKLSRYTILNIIMIIIFGAIVSKLVYLQVYKHEDYKERADVGSTRFVAENAPRGMIYDSKGNVLATNKQTYTLTYTETTEATKAFYETIDKIFKILSENDEKFQDDLLLKINGDGKFYYDFKTDDAESRKAVEKLFKRDRGLNEGVQKKLFEDHKGDLTDEQIKMIDEELLKMTPEDTFYELVKIYDMYELILDPEKKGDEKEAEIEKYEDMSGKEITDLLLEKYSINEIRNYMVIKDTIKMQSFKGYRSVTIANNIKRDTAFVVYQKLNDLPGIDVRLKPVREYPYKNLASSVLGYMSSIGSWEEEEYSLLGYDVSSDLVGTAGIEAAFEEYLKGTKGGTTIKVNSKGKETEKLFELESHPGNNVHLTIDKDIQYAAQKSLEDQITRLTTVGIAGELGYTKNATRGATVAIEVKTGRILALASYPDYDPNLFAIPGQLTPEQNEQYFSPNLEEFGKNHIANTGATKSLDEIFIVDEETGIRQDTNDIYPRSFFNYATQGLIPPGSSFKPITAVAGLEDGVFGVNETINDTGIFNIHSDELGENYAPTNFGKIANGIIDVRGALEKSSNFYFFETAYRMYNKNGANVEALDSLAKYAWKFGLGRDPESKEKNGTGIEIAENTGTMHTFQEFKDAKIRNSMFEVVEFLNNGKYYSRTFIPLDIGKSDYDKDELKKAKQDLKDKILEQLELIGTDEELEGYDDFVSDIKINVLEVMKHSPSYKESIASNGGNVDTDYQAEIIANALGEFTIHNKPAELLSVTEMINAAIGQGMSNFTPLEIANAFATLGNNGVRNRVRLVDKVTTPDGEVLKEFKTEQVDKIDIASSNYEAIKEGMRRVNASSGYMQEVFGGFPIVTGGKTGTADFASSDERYSEIGRKAYATYGGFAPLDDPEIAVFTVIYDGYRGSYASMPARAIYEAYFKDRLIEMDPTYPQKSEFFKKYVTDSPYNEKKDESEETKTEDVKKED